MVIVTVRLGTGNSVSNQSEVAGCNSWDFWFRFSISLLTIFIKFITVSLQLQISVSLLFSELNLSEIRLEYGTVNTDHLCADLIDRAGLPGKADHLIGNINSRHPISSL